MKQRKGWEYVMVKCKSMVRSGHHRCLNNATIKGYCITHFNMKYTRDQR